MKRRFVITAIHDREHAVAYFMGDSLDRTAAEAKVDGPMPIVGNWTDDDMQHPWPVTLKALRQQEALQKAGRDPDRDYSGFLSHWELEYRDDEKASTQRMIARTLARDAAFRWLGLQRPEVKAKIAILIKCQGNPDNLYMG
jgi:hypothetical protein